MLIVFNILTYDKILQFEQNLSAQVRVRAGSSSQSMRQNSGRRFREGSRSTISEYHHSGRGRGGSNAVSQNSAQHHSTVGISIALFIAF